MPAAVRLMLARENCHRFRALCGYAASPFAPDRARLRARFSSDGAGRPARASARRADPNGLAAWSPPSGAGSPTRGSARAGSAARSGPREPVPERHTARPIAPEEQRIARLHVVAAGSTRTRPRSMSGKRSPPGRPNLTNVSEKSNSVQRRPASLPPEGRRSARAIPCPNGWRSPSGIPFPDQLQMSVPKVEDVFVERSRDPPAAVADQVAAGPGGDVRENRRGGEIARRPR